MSSQVREGGDMARQLAAAKANAADLAARVEALADKLAAEAAPYLPCGSRYGSASDTLRARADARDLDATSIRVTLRGDS